MGFVCFQYNFFVNLQDLNLPPYFWQNLIISLNTELFISNLTEKVISFFRHYYKQYNIVQIIETAFKWRKGEISNISNRFFI